jgi:predicted LPLAT superfamily acyltransferase
VAQGFYACTEYLSEIIENNPLLSAKRNPQRKLRVFCFTKMPKLFQLEGVFGNKKSRHAFLAWRRVSMLVLNTYLGSLKITPTLRKKKPKTSVVGFLFHKNVMGNKA